MTVSNIEPVNNYSGNSSTTTFDFDFYIEDETQLDVFLTDNTGSQTKLIYNQDYSIREFKNKNGSYITYPISGSSHPKLASDVGNDSDTNGVSDYEETFVITTFELIIVMRTVQSLTFPSEVVWLDGNAPDLSKTGVYFLAFRTLDNGNHWAGNLQGKWDLAIDFINES